MKVTIEGAQGEGKTTLAEAIVALVLAAGHTVEFFDSEGGRVMPLAQSPEEASLSLMRARGRLEHLNPTNFLITVRSSR